MKPSEADKEDDQPLTALRGHEVLHTASVIAGLFEREIAEHRYVEASPELSARAERAAASRACTA